MPMHPQLPLLLAWFLTLLTLVFSAEPALAQTPSLAPHLAHSTPTAFVIALDTSGSMMRGNRFETATHVASTTVEELPLREDLRVVLVAASDSVSVLGTFVLASEADRSALLRAVHGMQPLRATHTSFSRIDEGLATTVRERLQPDEQLAVLFVTDGLSDDPAHDLAATNLGRHARDVGRGVLAVWSGALPTEPTASAMTRRPRALPPTRSDGGRAQLLELVEAPPARWTTSAQHLTAQAPFLEGLRGERTNAEAFATLSNPASFARTYTLEAAPIDGVSISFPTPTVTVPAGGSVQIPVRVAFRAPHVDAILHLVARAPGERAAAPTRIALTLETVPWRERNQGRLLAGMVLSLGLLIATTARARRALSLMNAQDPACTATLSPSGRVLLSQFAKDLPDNAGSLERDFFGRLYVRADAQPLTSNGAIVPPNARARYVLGNALHVGSESLRVVRAHATASPAFSAAPSFTDPMPLSEY